MKNWELLNASSVKRGGMMKLQLALDRLTREECLRLARETNEYIDIIEIGTGVIKEYGMSIIREMKGEFPNKTILADMKTCDAGKAETIQAFDAGADISTVMAFSSNNTIKEALGVAQEYGKEIMIDLLEVQSRQPVAELKELGADLVSLHVGKDNQNGKAFETKLFSLVKGLDFKVAVAGGINIELLPAIISEKPDIVIVGSAITKEIDSEKMAMKIKKQINQSNE